MLSKGVSFAHDIKSSSNSYNDSPGQTQLLHNITYHHIQHHNVHIILSFYYQFHFYMPFYPIKRSIIITHHLAFHLLPFSFYVLFLFIPFSFYTTCTFPFNSITRSYPCQAFIPRLGTLHQPGLCPHLVIHPLEPYLPTQKLFHFSPFYHYIDFSGELCHGYTRV